MSWTSPLWRRVGGRDRRPLGSLTEDGFVALDLETTGLDSRRDVPVALAAIPFVGGQPREGLVTLIDPGRPIPAEATAVHGITDAMIGGAPSLGEVLASLEPVWDGQVVVGHGVAFDLAILDRARRRAGRPRVRPRALDTMALAAALFPDGPGWTLDEVAARRQLPIEGRHTARGDAEASGRLLLGFLPEAAARGCRTVPELFWLQELGLARLR